MNKLISIIVPIYKVENYLKRCIDSILNQTYTNLEIILVDDGSPDNCGIICDEYAKQDCRVKVIHKKNGGLSDARNCGIKVSTGEYLIFVDSDDYILKNMCETLLKNALENNADIVSCNFKEVYLNGQEKINKQSQNQQISIVSNAEAIYRYFVKNDLDMNVVWNKIYKKNIFLGDNKIEFPVGRLHEDDFTVYKLYYYANKVVIINDILYNYFKREESITGNFSRRNIFDKIDAVIEQYNFFEDKENDLKDMTKIRCIDSYVFLLKLKNKMLLNERILNKKFFVLKKYILDNEKNILRNPYINLKRYIKYIMIYFKLECILNKL